MKVCTFCKERKKKAGFNKNKAKKDGLQTHCRECSHKKFKDYYDNNKDAHKAKVREDRIKARKRNKGFLMEYLSDKRCTDCGEDDILVLEFDHLRDKKNDISRMVNANISLSAIKEEITKCDVVCANCHRRRTHKRLNSYRARYESRG